MKKFLRINHIVLFSSIFGLTQLAQATSTTQTRDFVFNYGAGVSNISIDFDQANYNVGQTNVTNVSSSSTSTKATVYVTSDLSNSSTVASKFNSIYSSSYQTLELNSSAKSPDKLDFLVQAKITIDGLPVKNSSGQHGFSWAHDGKTGNWWIANDVFVNRNLDNTGLTIATYDGNQSVSYCMKADKGSSYSVTVSKGACSTTTLNFVFNYDGVNVTSVEFRSPYNPALSSGLLSYENISSQSTTQKTTLTFTSQLNNNLLLADQFNNAYAADHSLNLNGATTDKASAADLWAEGDLYINNSRVVKTAGESHTGFSFVHEYSTQNWWIADNNGTANISPDNFYLLDLTTEDGNNYCMSGDKGSNYSVTVTPGKCSVPGLASYEFKIKPGIYISSLSYKASLDNPDPNNLPNFKSVVATNTDDHNVVVTVTSVQANSADLAKDFIARYDSQSYRMMELTSASTDYPKALNFWLSGTLKVEYYPSDHARNTDTLEFDFELAQDGTQEKNWWISSDKGNKSRNGVLVSFGSSFYINDDLVFTVKNNNTVEVAVN